MKQYDLMVELKENSSSDVEVKKCKIVLSDNEDVLEAANMIYGSWYDIISVNFEECELIHISKKYLIEEAHKLIRFE